MKAFGDALTQMVKTFRQECPRLKQSERTTVHGADAMLMVLQLAMADVSKQQSGEFKVALSDVLMVWKHLLLHKLHLQSPGAARLENYDLILEAYEGFLKRSNTIDLVDILSVCKELRGDSEELVSPVQLFEFLSGNKGDGPASSVSSTPCSSQVKAAVRRVFYSYLSLLINTKNDLALALTLDVPSRSLGRQTFTDVKHAAQNSSTSLFLALTSFVRAIQLGGKGYAPAESDPLRKHVKGLSSFVQFLDSLEEILGDTPDPSVCGSKLVSAIRAVLVKGCSGEDAVMAAAEETAAELKDRICQLNRIQKETSLAGGTGISPARTNGSCLAAQSVRCQSRHGVWRPRHGEAADGAAGRGSAGAALRQQSRAAVRRPARPQRKRGDMCPHLVQIPRSVYWIFTRAPQEPSSQPPGPAQIQGGTQDHPIPVRLYLQRPRTAPQSCSALPQYQPGPDLCASCAQNSGC
uniref:PCNA-interacting partner isoform X2 n=1 Tax=Doryrhamphus excisus TaxID=161450 RepID=UPI0025AE444F|nr:PCNA-interacting partner isoform X2 [Doryrhamphus excisus]